MGYVYQQAHVKEYLPSFVGSGVVEVAHPLCVQFERLYRGSFETLQMQGGCRVVLLFPQRPLGELLGTLQDDHVTLLCTVKPGEIVRVGRGYQFEPEDKIRSLLQHAEISYREWLPASGGDAQRRCLEYE